MFLSVPVYLQTNSSFMIFGSWSFERLSSEVGGFLLHLYLRIISHEDHFHTRSKVLRSYSFMTGISGLAASADSHQCEEMRRCCSNNPSGVDSSKCHRVAGCDILDFSFIKLVVMEMAGSCDGLFTQKKHILSLSW